jgi:hypothetical protein
VVLNDQLVGGDADVKGVLFGPSDTLEPALLGTAKVDEDLEAGLEKTQVKKKKTSQVGFLVFLGFFGFFGAFYTFAQKREFLGFFQFQEYFWVYPDFKLKYIHKLLIDCRFYFFLKYS